MNIIEVIGQAKHGDQFKRSSSPGLSGIEDIRENEIYNLTAEEIMADDWQIIRSEPEVLTDEDLIAGVYVNPEKRAVFTEKEIIRFSKKCDKNGQNKEWKRLKPLIDAAKNVRKYCATLFESNDKLKTMCDLSKALENLTPPWEIE